MKPCQVRLVCFFVFCGAGCLHLEGQSAVVRGSVRDDQGAAVGGASVKLTCEAIPARSAQTASAADGTYRMAALLPCEYRLSAAAAGTASVPAVFTVTPSGDEFRNLILLSVHAGQESAAAAEKPKFAASGIRGLIDPGGYSAPANAAAATGMLSGMAAVQRDEVPDQAPTDCRAEAELLRTVAQQPSNALAQRNLEKFYLHQGAYEKALPLLQAALQRDTKDAHTRLDVAEALLKLQRFEEAHAQLHALPDDPQNKRLHRLLAKADEGSGQFRQAAAEYSQLNKLEANENDSFGAGYELILDGKPGEAEALFREALLRFPQSVTLWIGEGTATFLQGQASTSIGHFLRAADLDPSDPRPYPFLAAASATSPAQAARVLATLARHVQPAPADAGGLLAYASALGRAATPDATDNTRILLQRAIALQPDLAQAYFELGVLETRSGDNAKAIAAFQKVLQLQPSRTEARYRLSLVLRRSGQSAAAKRELQLFQGNRAHDNEAGNADMRQFLSVMQSAKNQPHPNSCPEVRPPG